MRGVKAGLIALAAALGVAVTLGLGFWQWGRAQEKIALHQSMEARQALPPVAADAWAGASAPGDLLHRRVVLRGAWVPERTIYLDNRQMRARPGFYVVTPLRLAGSGGVVLVQRGWVQRDFSQRDRLPTVQTPAGEVEVAGRLAPPPAKLYAFDQEEKGAIRQNLDLGRFRAETGLPLLPLSVQQTGAPSEGLLRDWPQPATGADKNYGYAFQWWAMSGLITILYVWFQFIVPRRRRAAPGA
ncbi:SURF1 family protein [Caenimonas sedimenti]|uniref:SURF1-like protein n=1 Tax=Caenimonas sedimenti TaxID=2596921 RepID=A0A562ZPN8_9BURK|nr:SURF1 family protein [Caenimonas sedimenti]TWO70377.1 SURF1 family protein [Caenimonas sedimenti]